MHFFFYVHFEEVVLALFCEAFNLQTLFGDVGIPDGKVRLLLHLNPIIGKFHSAFEQNEEVFWLKKNKTRWDVNIDQVSIVYKYALSQNSGMNEN